MKRSLFAFCLFLTCPMAWAATAQQYYEAGLQLYQQRQYNQAALYFKAAVQMDPSDWQAYQGLGSSYYAEGDKTDALEAYDRSLALHPNPQLQQFSASLRGSSSDPSLSSAHREDTNPGPVVGGGNFGIGLELGDPGSWGFTGKYWLDQTSAFQGEVKLNGAALFQLAYLWHDFDLIHPQSGAFPFYIGVGGDLAVNGGIGAAAEVPVGLSYLFQRQQVPLELYVQVEPTLWITNGLYFQILGNLGARYYF